MTSGEYETKRVSLTRDEFAAVAAGIYRPGDTPRHGPPETEPDLEFIVRDPLGLEAQLDHQHGPPSNHSPAQPADELLVEPYLPGVVDGEVVAVRGEVVDETAPVEDQIATEVRNRARAALIGNHDRLVQNEIGRGFYRGEVVDAMAAEQRAVSNALDAALSTVLGEIAKGGQR